MYLRTRLPTNQPGTSTLGSSKSACGCVCVCVRVRERECECVRERNFVGEWVSESLLLHVRQSVCVCMCGHMHPCVYVCVCAHLNVQICENTHNPPCKHHPATHSHDQGLMSHLTVVLMTFRLGFVWANRVRSSIAVKKLKTRVRALTFLV